MKRIMILTQLFLITNLVNAQHAKESTGKQCGQAAKEELTEERLFHIEYAQGLKRDFDSELFGKDYQDAKIKKHENLNATVNIPVYKKEGWEIEAIGMYQFNRFEFDDISNEPLPIYFERNGSADYHYFASEIKMLRFSQIFDKPIMYMGSIKGDGNHKEFGRLKASFGFSIILKQNERTTLGLGAMAFIDPSEQFPYIPMFIYNHKFRNSKWELDMLLPDRIMIKRPIGQKGRLSFGTSLENTCFYIDNKGAGKSLLQYSQLELHTGFKYEHRINHFLSSSVKAGLLNFLDSRITEKGDASDDEIYTNSQNMTGYIQVGISFHPFAEK